MSMTNHHEDEIKQLLHDMSNTVTSISILMENMQDMLPMLKKAYQIAQDQHADVFSSLNEEDLMLFQQTLEKLMPRIDKLHEGFKTVRRVLNQ